jgi:ParB/RepB/Spo0J family partition protein
VESELQFSTIKIDLIDPNLSNPNEMDEVTLARLCEEIRENGFIVPIHVIPQPDGRYRLLNGEHRWKAAVSLGYEHLPAIVLSDEKWFDQDTVDLVNIRLNEIRGTLSAQKLTPIYERVVTKHGSDAAQKILGITHDEVFKKQVKKMIKSIQAALPNDLAKQVQKLADKTKTPADLGKSLSRIFAKQAEEAESNCVVFRGRGKDHVLVRCTPDLYAVLLEIMKLAEISKVEMNKIFLDALVPALNDLKGQVESAPTMEVNVLDASPE